MSSDAMTTGNARRGLDTPRTGRRIYWALSAVCGLLLLADLLYHKHVHYRWESWFGFFGFFGFFSAFGLVLAAKGLRKVLMRGEDYYDRADD